MEDDPITASAHAKRFVEVLTKNSVNKDEPIREWVLVPCLSGKSAEQKKCICEKDINNLYIIKNKLTDKTLVIGSECAKRFGFERQIQCEECGEFMTAFFRRVEEKDYFCNVCKKEAKKTREHRRSWSIWVYCKSLHRRMKFSFQAAFEIPELLEYLMNEESDDKNVEKFRDWVHSMEILGEIEVQEVSKP